MNGKELSEALRSGRRVYGSCVTSTAPGWPSMIASTGVDMAFIDTEHTPIDRAQLSWICRTYTGLGVAPVVRVPQADPILACMVLDGGAAGVVAPYIENAEQVRQLRGAVKLRPLKGERLQNVLAGTEQLNEENAAYLGARAANCALIINIESVPAVNRLDEILAVPGLDGVLIGPHDLSISLDLPEEYTHPKFLEAVSTIIKKCRAANVGVGIHFFDDINQEIDWAKEGANLIMHSTDVFLCREILSTALAQIRRELGDAEKTLSTRQPSQEEII